MEAHPPPEDLMVMGNVENRSSITRSEVRFKLRAHGTDSGLVLYDPADYYVNMSLEGVVRLIAWMGAWLKYQREKFKPTGFRLVNLTTGEQIERPEGAAIVVIGDSFVIQDEHHNPISEAMPIFEWDMQAIFAPTP